MEHQYVVTIFALSLAVICVQARNTTATGVTTVTLSTGPSARPGTSTKPPSVTTQTTSPNATKPSGTPTKPAPPAGNSTGTAPSPGSKTTKQPGGGSQSSYSVPMMLLAVGLLTQRALASFH